MKSKVRFPLIITTVLMITVLLSGCSLLNDINQSLDYADQTTAYINDVSEFADRVRADAEQAVTNSEAAQNLREEVEAMKEKIVDFNAVEPPQVAVDFHEQLVANNEQLLADINGYLEQIANQDYAAVFDSELFRTIENIVSIQQQLEQLGL